MTSFEAAARMSAALETLQTDTDWAEKETDVLRQAACYHDEILRDMETLRTIVDEAERLIPDRYLPYPTYGEMLFSLR